MGMTNDGLSYWQAETGGQPLLETTIGNLLDQRAADHATQEAVVYSCYPEFGGALDIRWTFQEYCERANAVARGLMALGLNKGEHIAIWAVNVPEWPLLQMGAAKAGLVLVTVNPALRASEVEYILKQGDVVALFFMAQIREHNCLETMRAMTTPGARRGDVSSERLPRLRYMSLVGAPLPDLMEQEGWRPTLFAEMVAGGAAISDEARAERQASITPHESAMMLYTSGTTGFPKGALLTHYNLTNQAQILAERAQYGENARGCVLVPFYHIFGCVGYNLISLCSASTVHPLLGFDPLKAMQVISTERCTFTGGVPTMLFAMLQHPDFDKYDLSSLQAVTCAGAPVPVYLMEQVKERIGADVLNAFGQTENTGAMTMTLRDASFELKSATVGIPLPHIDVKVIDPVTGTVTLVGEHGEICARGWLVMQGYYNMPDMSAEAVDADGWLHTGDLAAMDAEGNVTIVGRLKEMIIRGGENIFPREIEEFLIRHPKVADVAVLGVPDAYWGEEALAVVKARDGESVTEEELRAFCTGQIAKQKIPRYFQFVTDFPMTASGKVQKFILREQAINQTASQVTSDNSIQVANQANDPANDPASKASRSKRRSWRLWHRLVQRK